MDKVSVVIPIFNGIDDTVKCLESLSKVNYKELEVIIVDDGSTDNSSEVITNNYPNVIILRGNGELWWSGGVNKGIEYALNNNSEFIVLLNNDNIVKEDFIQELLKSYEEKNNSIIASKVYSLDNVMIHLGGYFSMKQGLKLYKSLSELPDKSYEIEWCGGMGVLIHKSIFDKIGLFDNSKFPQYYGDADFMYRARKYGYSIYLSEKSVVWNNVESTGVKASVNKISELKTVLTSIKSNNNIKINWQFYKRHFGVFKAIIVMLTRYYYILGGFVKRNLIGVQ